MMRRGGNAKRLYEERMPQLRFNHVFFGLMALGLASSYLISPSVTNRAKGKAELLLLPVVKPVSGIGSWFNDKYAQKKLPPGETRSRADSELMLENHELRQQVVFLTQQLEELRLVQAERKRLGKLLDYFVPVGVIGADASPGRESLAILPASGTVMSPDSPVMCAEGLVGKIVEGRRVRLATDKDFAVTGRFGRYENNQWVWLNIPKASARGGGQGVLRVDHLTLKEVESLKPGDWIVIAEPDWPDIVQGRQIGQVESKRPLPSKPVFAEVIVKPRTDLRKLREVLVMKKS